MHAKELAVLSTDIDEATGGALYTLRLECEENGWRPHLWAQTPSEGSPNGLTRLIFLGSDSLGKTMFWDTALVHDTSQMAAKIKISTTLQEAARAAERIREGLARIERGLNPRPETVEVRGLN